MDRPQKHRKPDHKAERSTPTRREILARALGSDISADAQMEFLLDHLERAQ